MIEQIMVEKIRNGDHITFEVIFNAHFPSLVRYANGMIGSKSDAEDLVADCFIWLWQEREKIVIQKSLQAFLYSIVYHSCLNFMKRKKVHRNYEAYLMVHSIKVEINHPETRLIEMELTENIRQGINKLPEQCRLIFKLSRHDGLKYEEIALKLNISIHTVKTHMSRALFKLRDHLKDNLKDEKYIMNPSNKIQYP